MILAVCFRRSVLRAHFSPREIVCLPTAMTFARKIRRYRFQCIVLACKPAWRYGFTYGVGGLPDSRIARCIGATLPRCSSGATCRVTLPDSRRGRRGGATLPDPHQGRRGGATLSDSRWGRRAALPGSRGEGCVKQRVPLSRPSASACVAFPSLFDCGSCRAMTHVISSIGLQKLT